MEKEKVVIGFAGDVMIGRTVDPVISREGYLYVWGDVLPVLRSTDVNIINLETTLTTSNKKVPKVFNFKAAPDKVKSLTEAHITIANIANNHILDYSEEGMTETIHTLEKAGILYAGAGMNSDEAAKPVILEKKKFRIGLLGFTDNEPGWEAGTDKSGTNYINVSNETHRQRSLEAIEKLRKQVDIVIVSLHWGPNMREAPSKPFVAFAHEMIEHGADIIHGHSAHIFQAIEVYKNKLILYDTGDFVDDYVVNPVLKNNHSFFYKVEISNEGIENLELIPVLISNYQVNLAEKESYEWSMKRVQQLSSPFGTVISNNGDVKIKAR